MASLILSFLCDSYVLPLLQPLQLSQVHWMAEFCVNRYRSLDALFCEHFLSHVRNFRIRKLFTGRYLHSVHAGLCTSAHVSDLNLWIQTDGDERKRLQSLLCILSCFMDCVHSLLVSSWRIWNNMRTRPDSCGKKHPSRYPILLDFFRSI